MRANKKQRSSKQCSEPVQRGRVYTSLQPQVVIHEIGHAIGFFHEQSRADRDGSIRVLWENIPQDKYSQFTRTYDVNYKVPYDVTSIMQYSQTVSTYSYQNKLVLEKNYEQAFCTRCNQSSPRKIGGFYLSQFKGASGRTGKVPQLLILFITYVSDPNVAKTSFFFFDLSWAPFMGPDVQPASKDREPPSFQQP